MDALNKEDHSRTGFPVPLCDSGRELISALLAVGTSAHDRPAKRRSGGPDEYQEGAAGSESGARPPARD